jgi:hypothetical protein
MKPLSTVLYNIDAYNIYELSRAGFALPARKNWNRAKYSSIAFAVPMAHETSCSRLRWTAHDGRIKEAAKTQAKVRRR